MKRTNAIIRWYLSQNYKRVSRYMKHPIKVQQGVLNHLIRDAKQTEWGKKYNYNAIRTVKDFSENVPLGDYETHKPFINRMMHGEKDILWQGRVKWYSKSSGTTNDKSKYLPVSKANLYKCHIQGPRDLFAMFYKSYPDSNFFAGKGIVMGGNYKSFEPYPSTKYGDVSSIMIESTPAFFKSIFYACDVDFLLMEEFEEKIDKIAHATINQNVTNISGVPTWTLVLFRKILEITGKDSMLDVWPNFQTYMHGGVNFEPYRTQFQEIIPSDKMNYFENYNASEGYFAVQLEKGKKDLLLLLDNGVFYEFIPMSEWHKENPCVVSLDKVELGVNYAMVISTNAGLWRYQTGDTVSFLSLLPFTIQITGRTKHFINAFGEEVMVANTDQAIAMTCAQTEAVVTDYTVAPIYISRALSGKGGHEWLIEFKKMPVSLSAFKHLLDENLQMLNSDYEAKRYKNMALNELTLRVLPNGTFHKWLKSKGKFGGQSKIPRLSNHRRYVDEIVDFM